jgi:hypothetical protein
MKLRVPVYIEVEFANPWHNKDAPAPTLEAAIAAIKEAFPKALAITGCGSCGEKCEPTECMGLDIDGTQKLVSWNLEKAEVGEPYPAERPAGYWEGGNGWRAIANLSDRHLLNIIRFLRRKAPQDQRDALHAFEKPTEAPQTYEQFKHFNRIDLAKAEGDNLCALLFNARGWSELVAEATKRGHDLSNIGTYGVDSDCWDEE